MLIGCPEYIKNEDSSNKKISAGLSKKPAVKQDEPSSDEEEDDEDMQEKQKLT